MSYYNTIHNTFAGHHITLNSAKYYKCKICAEISKSFMADNNYKCNSWLHKNYVTADWLWSDKN